MKYLLFLFALLMLATGVRAQDAEVIETLPSNRALFESGIEFGLFLDKAERRREMWLDNFGKGTVPEDLQSRLDGLHGPYYLIAVAIDGCSDSVNTIPYLAHMADASDQIEMRIVHPDTGRHIMDSHRTPDDRPSTPTVLILDQDFNEIGVFIERPAELQDWALGEGKELESGAFMKAKFAWYDSDLGRQTMTEVIESIEHFQADSSHEHEKITRAATVSAADNGKHHEIHRHI
jgi:hypothetical protein